MISSMPPIAMLHHVSDEPIHDTLKPYCISRKSFLQLINYLEENNYQTIGFDELRGGAHISQKKVILTFDDCPKHLFDFAIPELQKRKLKAVFYMSTAYIGGYNTWDKEEGRAQVELMNEIDLKELSSMGMEIGAHSHHHIRLKDTKTNKLRFELSESKRILESFLLKEIISFAYPFGSVPTNYQLMLSAAGYQYASSIYAPFENKLCLRRFIYHDGDTIQTIRQKLSWPYKWYRFLTDPLKKYS